MFAYYRWPYFNIYPQQKADLDQGLWYFKTL